MAGPDQHSLDPQALFADNNFTQLSPNLEKQSLSMPFAQAAGGYQSLSPAMVQSAGLQQVINPKGAIDLNETSPLSGYQVETTGRFLQEMKLGKQGDSFFSAACSEVSKGVQEISQSMNPQQLAMDPRQLQPSMNFTMAPRPGFGFL